MSSFSPDPEALLESYFEEFNEDLWRGKNVDLGMVTFDEAEGRSNGQVQHCHRLVLASKSDFLRDLLYPFEDGEEDVRIVLPGVKPEELEVALALFYQPHLSEQNADFLAGLGLLGYPADEDWSPEEGSTEDVEDSYKEDESTEVPSK